ncbi:MAG: Rne/Rng family ribonuclease [Planctomycetota bacterium]|nr:MAG: Rne/Rng family ribonuclease [Planctomycetota bacterium]
MTDEPNPPATSESNASEDTPKKTTKKSSKKKTTKKPAAKKAATKKTTKKAAAKKTTKKAAKKKTSKKAAAKADAPAEEPDDTLTDPGVDADVDAEVDAGEDAEPAEAPEAAAETDQPEDTEPGGDAGDMGESRGKKKRRRRRGKGAKSGEQGDAKPAPQSEDDEDEGPAGEGRLEMVINYVPGEECRVAIVEDGQLEELFAEPTDRVSRVGNIYVGKVVNVEPAIQAAFVDFGCEENGFLHISDLHPQYFGNDEEATERVGKKTPRRDRPPIQQALKRGQEITVQVLKEGVGTKGPTLTSYLSIPGRFLVMMPGMDKVGVSRKEEDDDRRRAAKEILSQLDLPEGFGFILRTAGFDRNKTELKRDLAYLTRLWKDMERRRKSGNKPRPLYSESDLLLRSIRDLMTGEIRRVVIDSEPALRRAAQFIKIAAPRTSAKLAHYVGSAPIFHAFGIEEQIEAIHAREVPLPSGGRLVIDQTEALVAIDVNSGKSRSARDAETNAYQTNIEAVDAICRQLRLRDMGGLVVCDLIDMRHASHRKAIEQRFRDRLKRDRAKSTVGTISQFGILEMTRQRMRGSMESQHFTDCPMCHGRGLVQKPDSVAASALRDLSAIIEHDRVARVELVVHPRVAGALLSTKRTALTRIELHSGKKIDVRVSETLALDRVSFYAYDKTGADLPLEKMSGRTRPEPKVVEWIDDSSEDWAVDPTDEADETTAQKLVEEIARLAEAAGPDQIPLPGGEQTDDDQESGKKKKRRRRRRGKKKTEAEQTDDRSEQEQPCDNNLDGEPEPSDPEPESDGEHHAEPGEGGKKKRRRRRRRGRGRRDGEGAESEQGSTSEPEPAHRAEHDPEPESLPESQPKSEPAPEPKVEPKPKRRGLYAGARRKLAPSEVARISPD